MQIALLRPGSRLLTRLQLHGQLELLHLADLCVYVEHCSSSLGSPLCPSPGYHSDQAVAGAGRAARAGKHFCTVACTSRLLVVAARLPLVPALTTLTCCNHAAGRAAIRGGTLYAKTMTATAPATGAHGTTRCAAAMAKHHPDEPAAIVLLGKLQRPSQYAPRAQQGRRDHQACATTALQANIKDPREQPSA